MNSSESLFWADQAAREVVEREGTLKRGIKIIRTEMGMGASGVPHIGSAGDGIRSYAVSLALKALKQKTELVAFSDDLDGLRKVPLGFPKSLEADIGKPVSKIPDPSGCHKSFADHATSLLADAFDKLGVEFTLKKASIEYPKGNLDKEIIEILKNWKTVGEIIKQFTGQEKYLKQLPFIPFCAECGRVYTTVADEFDGKKIHYTCSAEFVGKNSDGKEVTITSCGYEGLAGLHDGKLAWKADFAARWRALKISFEAYGKDIADSVKVNDEISRRVLKWEPPLHSFYELFTERGGKKLSKSIGNVFTPQLWLRYASPESLRLVYLKKLDKTRVVDLEAIPAYSDEVNELAEVYFGKKKVENETDLAHMKRLYEFVNFLKPPKSLQTMLAYNNLVNLVRYIDDKTSVLKILQSTGHIPQKLKEADKKLVLSAIVKVDSWVEDSGLETHESPKISEASRNALKILSSKLKKSKKEKEIENAIYETMKESGLTSREFFSAVYQVLLGTPTGPRLLDLIQALGKDSVAKKLAEV